MRYVLHSFGITARAIRTGQWEKYTGARTFHSWALRGSTR